MAFRSGEQVEVCSKQEGFLGSYYEATVIKHFDNTNTYAVQYKNLVEEEDEVTPLIEKVLSDEIRPLPPRTPPSVMASGFSLFERVDAYDNDGWWAGMITGKQGSNYFVYFETTGDEIAYHLSRLRIHRDWVNGKWVFSKKKQY